MYSTSTSEKVVQYYAKQSNYYYKDSKLEEFFQKWCQLLQELFEIYSANEKFSYQISFQQIQLTIFSIKKYNTFFNIYQYNLEIFQEKNFEKLAIIFYIYENCCLDRNISAFIQQSIINFVITNISNSKKKKSNTKKGSKNKSNNKKKFTTNKKNKPYYKNHKFYSYTTKDCQIGKVDINTVLIAKGANAIWLNPNAFDEFDKHNRILYFFVLYINLTIENAFNNKVYNFNTKNDNYVN